MSAYYHLINMCIHSNLKCMLENIVLTFEFQTLVALQNMRWNW